MLSVHITKWFRHAQFDTIQHNKVLLESESLPSTLNLMLVTYLSQPSYFLHMHKIIPFMHKPAYMSFFYCFIWILRYNGIARRETSKQIAKRSEAIRRQLNNASPIGSQTSNKVFPQRNHLIRHHKMRFPIPTQEVIQHVQNAQSSHL